MTPRASRPRRKARAGEHQQWEGCAARLPWPLRSWLGCLPGRGACLPPLPSPLPQLPPQAPELLPQGDASPLPGVGESDQSTPLPEAVEEPDHPLHEALLTRRGEDGFAFRIRYPIAYSCY